MHYISAAGSAAPQAAAGGGGNAPARARRSRPRATGPGPRGGGGGGRPAGWGGRAAPAPGTTGAGGRGAAAVGGGGGEGKGAGVAGPEARRRCCAAGGRLVVAHAMARAGPIVTPRPPPHGMPPTGDADAPTAPRRTAWQVTEAPTSLHVASIWAWGTLRRH